MIFLKLHFKFYELIPIKILINHELLPPRKLMQKMSCDVMHGEFLWV